MSINSYLTELSKKLYPNESELSSIKTSIESLKSKLNSYFSSDISEVMVFGSYSRGTILPRKADSNSDIDVMVVFRYTAYTPQTYLNKLKDFAERYYNRSEIHQSSPTIVLELNHIKFEIVPAKCEYGNYYIIDKQIKWMRTDPNGLNSNLTTCNTNNKNMIKPVVRLIKYWNIEKNSRGISSYELEEKISSNMTLKCGVYTCSTNTEYLIKLLEIIRQLQKYNEVDNTINKIKEALEMERSYPTLALNKIKEIFPSV